MALQYKTCKSCGRIFQSAGADVCPECLREMEEQFKVIKDYLYQKPGASVEEISKETGIDEKLILHFLREGRLEMIHPDGSLLCEKCGAPITSGRLCKKCAESLSHALGSVLPKQKAPEETGGKRAGLGRTRPDKLHVDIKVRK